MSRNMKPAFILNNKIVFFYSVVLIVIEYNGFDKIYIRYEIKNVYVLLDSWVFIFYIITFFKNLFIKSS